MKDERPAVGTIEIKKTSENVGYPGPSVKTILILHFN